MESEPIEIWMRPGAVEVFGGDGGLGGAFEEGEDEGGGVPLVGEVGKDCFGFEFGGVVAGRSGVGSVQRLME